MKKKKSNKILVFGWDLVNYWDTWADEGAEADMKTTLQYMVERRFGHEYDGLYDMYLECIERNPDWCEDPDYKTEIYFDKTIPDDVVDFTGKEFKQHIINNFSNRIKFVS